MRVETGDAINFEISHTDIAFKFKFPTTAVVDELATASEALAFAKGSSKISRWHWAMLMDRARNDPYDQAIRKAVKKASAVLDIGSGTGLLSMFAARAGAKHIYTVEGTEAMAQMAKKCIEVNGYDSQITGFCMMSTDMEVGKELPQQCDLVISEIVDVGLLGEHALPSMVHARDNLLTPDAQAIPSGAVVHAFLFEMPCQAYSVLRPLGVDCGINLTPFNTFAYTKDDYQQLRMRDIDYTQLTDPFDCLSFDLTGRTKYSPEAKTVQVTATQQGTVHAICMWFTLALDEEISFCTAPWIENCWTQAVVFFDMPLKVKPGDVIDVPVSHDVTKIYFGSPEFVSTGSQ